METVCFSETSLNFYRTTRCHISKDNNVYSNDLENLTELTLDGAVEEIANVVNRWPSLGALTSIRMGACSSLLLIFWLSVFTFSVSSSHVSLGISTFLITCGTLSEISLLLLFHPF
jgi:hypothetical protein